MGALHEGHASLVRRCREECATAVASVYVNPAQFLPGEDFERYPRPFERDRALLESLGVHALFAPPTLYRPDFSTRVDVGELAALYEGAVRPGHFAGVAVVVLKLFHLVAPDRAYFGQKDAQQVAVVRKLVRDLDLPVEIVACDTVRDADGLALSSRNAYLSAEERRQAAALPQALFRARDLWRAGARDLRRIEEAARAPGLVYDYVACVDPDTFRTPRPGGPVLLVAAARVGTTRLLDNVLLAP